MLLDILSAGADPVTSVRKNSFTGGAACRDAYSIRTLPDLCVGIVLQRPVPLDAIFFLPSLEPRTSGAFSVFS